MRAFVTGGTGFVGANLVRLLLAENYEVVALARSKAKAKNLEGLAVEIVEADLTDPGLAEKMRGCQVLFHAAAHYSLWQADRDLLYRSNVLGTRNILACAQKAGIERTVYTSSVAAIGVREGVADETYQSPPDKLIGAYKQSKYYAEQEAYQAVRAGQDVVIVNPTTPVGPYDIKPTPTGEIILRFLRRQMPAYIDTAGLNFVDVGDVVRGHLLALEKGKSGERYILGHQNLSLKDFLGLLAELTGLEAPSFAVPAWLPLGVAWFDEQVLGAFGKQPEIPLDGVRMAAEPMYYSPAKAIRELGLPQTSLSIALKEAISWFRSNGYVRGNHGS